MKRFLYFANSTSDNVCMPVDNLLGIDASTASNLIVQFVAIDGTADSTDCNITITSGKAKEVVTAIVEAVNSSVDPVIVVADDVNSLYLDADITACSTITLT